MSMLSETCVTVIGRAFVGEADLCEHAGVHELCKAFSRGEMDSPFGPQPLIVICTCFCHKETEGKPQ